MARDLSSAEIRPSEDWVSASSWWLGDNERFKPTYLHAEGTDPHEVALFIKDGTDDGYSTVYLDSVAAALLGAQLTAAAREAVKRSLP